VGGDFGEIQLRKSQFNTDQFPINFKYNKIRKKPIKKNIELK